MRIGKPPRRVRVSERDWVLREAQALADEAFQASGRGGGADGKTGSVPKAFRVKVSGDSDEDVLVSVPAETGSETAERVRGERYVDETPAHLAVDKALSRVQASARYRYGVSESKTTEGGAEGEDERLPSFERVEGSGGSARALRRVLSEEDEDVAAEDATVKDDASALSESASRRASAARKAAERKRLKSQSARERGELEDKANAMFQKLDDEMREMKSFMAEVVHKDVIGEFTKNDDENGDESEDEDDVLDRSGDGEADVGAADPVGDENAEETKTRRDENADVSASYEPDAPLPVVEAGSEAAKRAAKRVSLSGEAVNPITVPDDFWTPTSDRGGVPTGSERYESSLPSAPKNICFGW